MLLVIRARDETSRAMHSMTRSMRNLDNETRRASAAQIERGRALSSLGIGVMAVGAAGAKVLYDWTKAAMEYNQASAKTLTQVDKQKISLEDIKKVGRDVAKAIPAPFEQMQKSLYDIFSSMDVSLEGSKHLLTEFSKAAVAGQVDLQDAARGTIGILNAYRLGAEGVNRVNDVMFQLVRKGVGTYAEFAKTIGRAVPSAVRAGQSIEDLAGMMAFLTRNGLSTAMAAASAGRALDAMSNPKTVKKFKEIGINVKKANGEFRPMSQIMTELGKKMANLTAPERAAALQELFMGSGGTIQARRFFDIAVKNFGELNVLTKDMANSSGSMKQAYDIMFKQPQSQIQLMKNNFEVLKTEMGDSLIPILLKLVQAMVSAFQWFNNLSPTTKKWITWITLGTTALLLIVGVIITVVGFIMIFVGAAAALSVSLGFVALIVGAVIASVVLFIAVVVVIIKYWAPISGFFIAIWNVIVAVFRAAWNVIWAIISTTFNIIWTVIKTGFTIVVTIVKVYLALILLPWILMWKMFEATVVRFFKWAWPTIKAYFSFLAEVARGFFRALIVIVNIGWSAIKGLFNLFWRWVGPFIKMHIAIVTTIFRGLFSLLVSIAKGGWNLLMGGVTKFWNAMKTGFNAGKAAVLAIWNLIKKPMAGPVNFIIDKVWNNGIAAAWNTAVRIVHLPDKFKAPHVNLISAATGGHITGPGGPRADKIPAWLSNGEYVVNAKQTSRWLPILQAINKGIMKRGMIPGFQEGGAVGKVKGAAKFLWNIITNPGKAMKNILSAGLGVLKGIGGGMWGEVLTAVPKRMIDMLVEGFKAIWKKFGGATGNAGKAITYARAQVGKPYIWGGTGPNGYDCSGLTWRAWLSAGKNITRTTDTQRQALNTIAGPIPGAMGQPHSGHTYMASRINPTYIIEAAQTGTNISEHLLTRSTPWWGFPKATGGLAQAGEIGRLASRMWGANFIYDPRRMQMAKWMAVAGDPGGVANNFGPKRPYVADGGGYLTPGLSAVNYSGMRERILDPIETRRYEASPGGSQIINVYTHEINPRQHAAELGWELQRRVT